MKFLILLLFLNVSFSQLDDLPEITSDASAQLSQGSEKIKVEYSDEDYFDFTALEVKGEVLTPGEINIKTSKRVRFKINKHMRRDFDDYIREDLIDIH